MVVIDQIHLVDRDHDMRNAQQVGQIGMAPGLGKNTFACIDQDDRQIRGRGGGDHVARVLLVTWGIGDDVFAPPGREVAIGDIDRDALLALGAEAVGQKGQINRFQSASCGSTRHGVQRVGQDGLGVKQQPADQGALAVIYTAAGEEAQQAIIDPRQAFNSAH